jgi:hypothetical protein
MINPIQLLTEIEIQISDIRLRLDTESTNPLYKMLAIQRSSFARLV